MTMIKHFWFYLILLFTLACGDAEAQQPQEDSPDAGFAADAGLAAVTTTPRPATMCHRHTVGLFIGDSIVHGVYRDAFLILQGHGDVVYSVAVAGHRINDQRLIYEGSPFIRGAKLDWIFIQLGVNDVIAGHTVADMDRDMTMFVTSIKRWNPEAKIVMGTMLPAKSFLDTRNVGFYQVWKDGNSLYQSKYGAFSDISDAVNDGADSLMAEFSSPDHIHMNVAGSQFEASLLNERLATLFPDIPCN
jgi:hypothetical protein